MGSVYFAEIGKSSAGYILPLAVAAGLPVDLHI